MEEPRQGGLGGANGGGQRWAGRQRRTHERAARTAPPPLPSSLQPPLQPPSPPLPPHQAAQASMCQSQQQSRPSRQSATRFNQRGKQVRAGRREARQPPQTRHLGPAGLCWAPAPLPGVQQHLGGVFRPAQAGQGGPPRPCGPPGRPPLSAAVLARTQLCPSPPPLRVPQVFCTPFPPADIDECVQGASKQEQCELSC